MVKNLPANVGDRRDGQRKLWAIIHGIAKSQTRLNTEHASV